MRINNNGKMKYFFLIILSAFIDAAPININPKIDKTTMKKLVDFGYLADESLTVGTIQSNQIIVNALKTFQRYAYIEETGVLDNATKTMMHSPRCGVADYQVKESTRQKRFTEQGTKWKKRIVTWQLENDNNDGLTSAEVRDTMKRSLAKWSAVAKIDFVETPNAAIGSSDIRVRFEELKHEDNFPFDGPSGTLAHAFFPLSNQGLSGDIHFDDAEKYTLLDLPRSSGTIKILWVAVHELGHSIGLSHSDLRGTVMYPWYSHFPGLDFDLRNDDIAGIQAIYGARPAGEITTTTTTTSTTTSKLTEITLNTPTSTTTTTTTTTPTTSTTVKPSLCISEVKSVLLYNDDETLIFNNNNVYVIPRDGMGVAQIFSVNLIFRGLKYVDAGHRRKRDNYVAFLHGDSFSVYDNRTRALRYAPRKISDGYQGLPEGFRDVDAAFTWSVNNKVYFFKGKEYWRFSQLTTQDYVLDFDYPKEIKNHWIGVPDNIDAVFEWSNKQTYFFKGDKYYRFNKRTLEVDSGYPQLTTRSFLKCKSKATVENLSSSSLVYKTSTLLLLLLTLISTNLSS